MLFYFLYTSHDYTPLGVFFLFLSPFGLKTEKYRKQYCRQKLLCTLASQCCYYFCRVVIKSVEAAAFCEEEGNFQSPR